MLFATRPRLFQFRLLALLVLTGSLASGCQSSRPSFSFQPMPGRARVVKGTEATAAAPVTAPEPAVLPVAVTQAKPVAYSAITPTVAPRQRQQRPRPELAGIFTEKNIFLPTTRPAAPPRRPLLYRSHGTAEAGLGTTVLGVLGLVTLPIALLGLLLSGGGLVWGIVAAAAALAVLVAYIDPFGRR